MFGAVGGGKADPAAADMTENTTFLGEIDLQTGRGGSSDLELASSGSS